MFHDGTAKIDQFVDYGGENKRNNTINYNISDGVMHGWGYDRSKNQYYVTSCIHIEFNMNKKIYHVYPVNDRPSLDDKYMIKTEWITSENIIQKMNDEIRQLKIDKSQSYEIPDACELSMITYAVSVGNNGYTSDGRINKLTKKQKKRR